MAHASVWQVKAFGMLQRKAKSKSKKKKNINLLQGGISCSFDLQLASAQPAHKWQTIKTLNIEQAADLSTHTLMKYKQLIATATAAKWRHTCG